MVFEISNNHAEKQPTQRNASYQHSTTETSPIKSQPRKGERVPGKCRQNDKVGNLFRMQPT